MCVRACVRLCGNGPSRAREQAEGVLEQSAEGDILA